MTKAYLLIWNPKLWSGDKDVIKKIKNKEKAIETWNCKNKNPVVGDEVYLLKTGVGIVAHGTVFKGSHKKKHFNDESKMSRCIEVNFDFFLDKKSQESQAISIKELETRFPGQLWTPRFSGIEINVEYIKDLAVLFDDFYNVTENEIQFEKITNYLNEFGGMKYVTPDKADSNREFMEKFKKEGQIAKKEFDNYVKILDANFADYEICSNSNWRRQSNEGEKYFWLELKRKDATQYPHSISVSINKYLEHDLSGEVMLSLRVEARDSKCEPKDYKYHNCLIEKLLPEESELYYQADLVKFDSESKSKYFGKDIELVKEGLSSGEIEKIKIVKNIDGPYEKSNTRKIINDSIKAFKELIPFYEYIIEKREKDNSMNNSSGDNIILYGPPGTGKTYNTVNYAVAICDGEVIDNVEKKEYSDNLKRYNDLKKEGYIEFVTFHQSYGYEEFIEGIKPEVDSNTQDVKYKIEDGIFKKFCSTAKKDSSKRFVFIIDEINRGNVSKIFGELITLIEKTKREGMDEQTSAVLPYSQVEFSVPSNVYIIGTMNTADRSISLMDTALRRRFRFHEKMPDVGILRDVHADDVDGIDVAEMLKKMNERISYLYDREHTIGHAFFTELKDPDLRNVETLGNIFKKSIIPLLQEYFYEDYHKIQLVLGDNAKKADDIKIILDEVVKVKDVFMGDVGDIDDLPEKKYMINTDALSNPDSYKQIYSN